MVLLLMNRVAKTIGGYLPKSLQWSSNPQKINATLWRQAKEKKEPGWALLHLRDLVTHSSSSTLLNSGCAVVPDNNISSGCGTSRKRVLIEIFGVQLLEKEETNDINQVLDENVVLYSTFRRNQSEYRQIEYILYDISCHKNLKINSEGYLILCGPGRGIEIKDAISICPYFDPDNELRSHRILWSFSSPHRYFYDCFLSCCMETRSGYLVVNFAVYSDGLEAKICVSFCDLELLMVPEIGTPLEVYGTVRTSNCDVTHSQAKSILFDCSCKDCAVLAHTPNGEAEISLPLSRTVMVIPRKSDLIVDVNLFLRCNSEDITIANDSVIFDAVKRSGAITEVQIISGNHGKVKVKLTWVEVLDSDVSSTEEEMEEWLEEEQCIGDKFDAQKGDEEAKSVFIFDNGSSKEWDGEKVDVENEGDEEAGPEFISDDNCSDEWIGQKLDTEKEGLGEVESEFMFDDDCSLGSFKLQDLNIEEDISTGAADSTVKEMLENEDGAQDASCNIRLGLRFLEVFSIRIVCPENFNLDEIHGFIMIEPYYLFFRRMRGDPPKIDSQGYTLLEGLRWSVGYRFGKVTIHPFLFKYQDFDFIDEETIENCLWSYSEYDKVLCKTIGYDMGSIEVNFAVYENAVQAHLAIMLTDCSFSSSEVYGTITATNSMLKDPRASSIVLKKNELRLDDVGLRLGKEVALPLSRPIIALPLASTLKLVIDIHSRQNSINCPLFEFPVELTGVYEKTLPANGCFVKIKVSFFLGACSSKKEKKNRKEGRPRKDGRTAIEDDGGTCSSIKLLDHFTHQLKC